MSLVNINVSDLSAVEVPATEPVGYFVDGDGTLFLPNSTELYPDAELFLSAIPDTAFLAFVSGNSDQELGARRATAIGANTWAVPKTDTWQKSTLYREVAQAAREHDIQKGVVIEDRWLMGVASGRWAVAKELNIDTMGVLVRRRGNGHETWVDKAILRPIETVGFAAAVAIGLDSLVRPRK